MNEYKRYTGGDLRLTFTRKQINNSGESFYVAFPVKASQEQVIEHLFLLVRTRRGGGSTLTIVNCVRHLAVSWKGCRLHRST